MTDAACGLAPRLHAGSVRYRRGRDHSSAAGGFRCGTPCGTPKGVRGAAPKRVNEDREDRQPRGRGNPRLLPGGSGFDEEVGPNWTSITTPRAYRVLPQRTLSRPPSVRQLQDLPQPKIGNRPHRLRGRFRLPKGVDETSGPKCRARNHYWTFVSRPLAHPRYTGESGTVAKIITLINVVKIWSNGHPTYNF